MKSILKTIAINVCILFLLGQPPFLAAQTPGAYGREDPAGFVPGYGLPQPKLIEKNSPAWKKTVKEVNFDNLPMGEVIGWLREQFPEVNFVSAPEVEEVPVRLTLRSVTLDDILTALNITSKGELMANPMSEKMVSFFYQPMSPQAEKQKKISRAFSLSGYLAGKSPEETTKALKDLEEALTVAWNMVVSANNEAREGKPALNLHAPTKMLIVVGTPEQLEMVSQFIDQLRSNIYLQPPVAPRPPVSPQPPQAPSPSTNKPGSTK